MADLIGWVIVVEYALLFGTGVVLGYVLARSMSVKVFIWILVGLFLAFLLGPFLLWLIERSTEMWIDYLIRWGIGGGLR